MGQTVRIRAAESRRKKKSRRNATIPAMLAVAATVWTPAWGQDAAGQQGVGQQAVGPQGGATLSLPAVSVTANPGNPALAADGYVAPASVGATKTGTALLETPQTVNVITR